MCVPSFVDIFSSSVIFLFSLWYPLLQRLLSLIRSHLIIFIFILNYKKEHLFPRTFRKSPYMLHLALKTTYSEETMKSPWKHIILVYFLKQKFPFLMTELTPYQTHSYPEWDEATIPSKDLQSFSQTKDTQFQQWLSWNGLLTESYPR